VSADPSRTLLLLRQRVLDLEAETIALQERVDRLEQLRADVSLAGLVQSLALDVALAEATMPDHVVTPVAISTSTYLVRSDGDIGLRFPPPDLADARALSSTSLELADVPGLEGRTPRTLYAVLQEKQRVYGGVEAGRIEGRIVAEIGKLLAASAAWTLPFLLEGAAGIGELELKLADAAGDQDRSRRASALLELAGALASKPGFVAGDVQALAAALDATTPHA
jgi:hypothetical protein